MEKLRHLRETLGVTAILALFILSFFSLAAAKYDTADHIWLILLLGIGAPAIFFTLGIRAFKIHSHLAWIFLLFSAAIFISFLFSQTKNFGFGEIIILSILPVLTLQCTPFKNHSWQNIWKGIVALGVISSLYGFWYFTTNGEARMAGLFMDAQNYRSFFPNAFADFLLMTWPLIFLPLKVNKTKWQKFLLALGLSIMLSALFLTYSRGAWAAFFFQIIVLGILLKKYHIQKKSWRRVLIMVSVTAFSCFFIFTLITIRQQNFNMISLKEKITFANSESSTSLKERLDFWKGSFKLIQEKPLLGWGPMSFRYAYPRHQTDFLAISDHPHNWILKIAVENGIPAAMLFLAFLFSILRIFIKKSKTSPTVLLLGMSLIGGLAHNMIDYNMNFIPNILLFLLLASGILAYAESKEKQFLPRTAAACACILFLFLLIISSREIIFTKWRKTNPESIQAFQDTFLARNFFRNSAPMLHLQKNPLDAQAQFAAGEPMLALQLDPANHFSYYRAVLEKEKTLSPLLYEKLMKYLAAYDDMLAKNIHYTAYTDNPGEAAKIYELLGNSEKAVAIREQAERIKKTYAQEHSFGKKLGPRTLREYLK